MPTTTVEYATQLVVCGRCNSVVDPADLESDPRWLEVCSDCHRELLRKHGAWSP